MAKSELIFSKRYYDKDIINLLIFNTTEKVCIELINNKLFFDNNLIYEYDFFSFSIPLQEPIYKNNPIKYLNPFL
jgi:hypothetical protein